MPETTAKRANVAGFRWTPPRAVLVLFVAIALFHLYDAILRVLLIGYAAAILAIVLNTIVRRIPWERKWATLAVGTLVITLLAAALFFGGQLLFDQLRDLVGELPEIQRRMGEWAAWIRQRTGIDVESLGRPLRDGLSAILQGGGGIVSRVSGIFGAVALGLVVLFGGLFALAQPNQRLLVPLMTTIPRRHHARVRRALDLLAKRLVGWAQGQLVAMLSVGILATLLFSLIGVPYALLLGVINALTEFIPIIGPWLGGGIAVTVAAATEPSLAVWAAAAAVAIQMIENSIITPLAMRERAHVHPFVTLLALLFFGAAFGFLGVLLAVPLVLFIWTVVQVFWVEGRLHADRTKVAPVVEE